MVVDWPPLSVGFTAKRLTAQDLDLAAPMQGDHAFALQLGECARDGLYRQTEVVGHILARHVKADFRVFGEPV